MALNIKNEETERLARELSRRRDQGITEVVTQALRKELTRERRRPRRGDTEDFRRRIQEIVDDMKRLPLLEPGGTHRIDLDDDLFD
jgi:antitoxin VapB